MFAVSSGISLLTSKNTRLYVYLACLPHGVQRIGMPSVPAQPKLRHLQLTFAAPTDLVANQNCAVETTRLTKAVASGRGEADAVKEKREPISPR